MLLDANVLLFSVDSTSPHHDRAAEWLTTTLQADRRVGLPWQTIGAFLRIATHHRAAKHPLPPEEAWSMVQAWLDTEIVWIPPAGPRTASLLGGLISTHRLSANLIPDAQLAALALEHGLTVVSADTDFARFGDVRWFNPLA